MLPRFPIWDDINTFDGRQWRGAIDVVSGGFPCQDISSAGKRAGITGERSGLWSEMLRVIGEVRSRFVFAENSPHLRTRGLGTILKGLTGLGYDCRWGVLGDCHAGGATIGARMWLVAEIDYARKRKGSINAEMAHAQESEKMAAEADSLRLRIEQRRCSWENGKAKTQLTDDVWPASGSTRVANGLANRMDRTRATGNGQVASLAAFAWMTLTQT
jgi:DNA (cytosine-5)-methyltransferase 1